MNAVMRRAEASLSAGFGHMVARVTKSLSRRRDDS